MQIFGRWLKNYIVILFLSTLFIAPGNSNKGTWPTNFGMGGSDWISGKIIHEKEVENWNCFPKKQFEISTVVGF